MSRSDSATKNHHYEGVALGLKGTVHDHRKHELSKNHYKIDDLKFQGNRSTRNNEKSHKKQSCTCQNNETSLNHPRGTNDSVMIKRKRRVSKQCLENMKKSQDLEADLRRKADDFISNEKTVCEKINDPFVLGSSVTKLQEAEDSLGTSKIPLHVSKNHYRQLTKTLNDSDLVDQDKSKTHAKSRLRKKAYNEYKIQKYQEKYKRRSRSRSTRRCKSKNFISKDNDILLSKEPLNVHDYDTVIYTDDNSSYVNIEDFPKNVKIAEKQYLTAESVLLEDQWTIRSGRSGSRKDALSMRQENYYKMVSESKVTEARLLDDIKRRIDQDFEESFYCRANDLGARSSLSSFDFDDNFGTRAVNEKAPSFERDSALNLHMRVKSEDSSKANDIFNLPREKLRNSRSASGMDDYVTVYSNDTQICSRPYSNLDLVSSKNFDNITRTTNLEQRYSLCDGESNEINISRRNYFYRRELLFENSKKFSQIPIGIENSVSTKSINNLSNYSDHDKSAVIFPWKTSKLDLVESVDSGVLTDFSKNDLHRNSQNDDMSDNKDKTDLETKENSAMRNDFLVSDSDDDSDVFLSKKLEKAVETFTEKLIMCERRAKARARQKNACILLRENTKHRKSKKKSQKDKEVQCSSEHSTKTFKSSYSITDPSKASQWSSEEEQIADLSTPSLFSLSDSEIESSEFIQPRNRIIFGRRI
ncbi:uncharacterized protein LOC107263016 isoform X2 [Cephus cinctus]|uniref:Uncharacterized protein LOC107263016 isoform X2 n=1 Tax=Cephus cinctus TaxID=211228 RepID=A0AAJ7RBI1_CEPCN|nr:uncharacterized protein LOC107263016 isoform X2 [Cephus cinctus]XP_024937841.1 uncharacterized protein LOC107263016 isoform X2 [Cephus cinctus]